jgi:hypothetical protein
VRMRAGPFPLLRTLLVEVRICEKTTRRISESKENLLAFILLTRPKENVRA